ncbi:MAG: bifunctional phosphoribosylaminoimidazolecarboxamide formyltransferase/IMP cyclohydrolase [Candidatus Eiseniibacteriota bacterium]
MLPVKNALFSLTERGGAVELARALHERGATLWATEGTARALEAAGLPVRAVSDLVGQGAWLGGRVKTLHPALLGGVLARRDVPADRADLEEREIPPIDLVVVTLYAFEEVPESASWDEAVEKIDVGGVTLLRAAAKNVRDVAVLSSPAQYGEALEALSAHGGIPARLRSRWARAAFERTASYDSAISGWMRAQDARATDEAPELWLEVHRRVRTLRYGENPHQQAALYARASGATGATGATGTSRAELLLEGKELSYNNLLDLDAAMALVGEFPGPACAIVKHNEPAGVGLGANPLEAFTRAFEADSLSAFGGVVAFNCEVDAEAAEALARPFLECVAAPSFAPRALQVLAAKKNLRLVATSPTAASAAGGAGASTAPQWHARAVEGGLLLQADDPKAPPMGLSVATRRAPTPAEMEALLFAWTVVAHARSNAIVIARAGRTLGVGSGQTSRIDAVEVALLKARRAGHDLAGAVLASDGFFPFGDWVEPARSAGITAAIQPGGSVRDAESIAACDAAGLAMVLTGRRQFRH